MLLLIKFASKIFAALNGEISPRQLAAGFALGAWIGLVPVGLFPTILLFLAFLVNVNLTMVFLAAAIFKLIGFAFDPVSNQIGFLLLVKADALKPFWTTLYNTPIVPYTRFNNTIVLGSIVSGFVLLIPIYLLASLGVTRYRTTYRESFRNSRFMKALTASTFYKYYLTYRDLRS